ncbi:MAG: SDR family oxidoreductase [Ruminococcus sp.]|nr:SDR family oxidoreductase [Ruminococcus sp.]
MADILIIGASSDMGRCFIERNHALYDNIIAHYKTDDSVFSKLKCSNIIPFQADMNDLSSTAEMINRIKERGLSPQYILHFASNRFKYEKFLKTTAEETEEHIRCSVILFSEILRSFLPDMTKKKSGRVVSVLSSCTVGNPPKFISPYAVSKYALLGLMNSLAAEYAEKEINFNSVSPEMTETAFISEIPPMIVEMSAQNSPMKRNMRVEEIVPVIEFLLSDKADMITGQNILVSGIATKKVIDNGCFL